MTKFKKTLNEDNHSKCHSPLLFQREIEEKLQSIFKPFYLVVTNDSDKHAGHAAAGAATHFSVYIVSNSFSKLMKVARHRLVYSALSDAFAAGLHALNITALTPDELNSDKEI